MFAHETSIYFCIHQVQNNSTRIVTQEAISIKFFNISFSAIPSVKCKKVQQKLVIFSRWMCCIHYLHSHEYRKAFTIHHDTTVTL